MSIAAVARKQWSYKNRTVLVIGTTGCGKSTFANFLLRRKVFQVTRGFSSSATAAEGRSLRLPDREMFIIDTPGFNDSQRPDQVLGTAVRLAEDGAHAILICVRAGSRFGKGEQNAVRLLEKLGNFWEHAIVVFTNSGMYGRDTDEKQKVALLRDIRGAPEELKWLMDRVNGRRVIVEALDDMGKGYYEKKLAEVLDVIEEAYANAGHVRYTNKLFVEARKKFKEEEAKQEEKLLLKKQTEEKAEMLREKLERLRAERKAMKES